MSSSISVVISIPIDRRFRREWRNLRKATHRYNKNLAMVESREPRVSLEAKSTDSGRFSSSGALKSQVLSADFEVKFLEKALTESALDKTPGILP